MPDKPMVPMVGWVVLDRWNEPILDDFHRDRCFVERRFLERRVNMGQTLADLCYPRIARVRIEEIEDAE